MLVKKTRGVNFTIILIAAFWPYSFPKKLQNQTAILEKLCKALLCEKAAHKMLVKLTQGKK